MEPLKIRFEHEAGFRRGGTQSKVGWHNDHLQAMLRELFGEANTSATIEVICVDPTGMRAIWKLDDGEKT